MSNSNTLAPIVTIKADRVVASSRDVAAYFGKMHKNVLQDIDGIIERLADFGRLNFQPTSYTDGFNREQRCIDMTRDGFTFLAMGFTGKRALEFNLSAEV